MEEIVLETKNSVAKSCESLKTQYSSLRTGRATALLLDRIEADYYGDKMPINQIASITVPEPRQLLVKPYDKNDLKAIVAAINSSDLGINPINDGTSIRLNIPPLTEERRRDLVKVAKKYSEDIRIAIRNIRRDSIDYIKSSDEYSEDMQKRLELEIQKIIDEGMKSVDSIFQEKEKEIMAV